MITIGLWYNTRGICTFGCTIILYLFQAAILGHSTSTVTHSLSPPRYWATLLVRYIPNFAGKRTYTSTPWSVITPVLVSDLLFPGPPTRLNCVPWILAYLDHWNLNWSSNSHGFRVLGMLTEHRGESCANAKLQHIRMYGLQPSYLFDLRNSGIWTFAIICLSMVAVIDYNHKSLVLLGHWSMYHHWPSRRTEFCNDSMLLAVPS